MLLIVIVKIVPEARVVVTIPLKLRVISVWDRDDVLVIDTVKLVAPVVLSTKLADAPEERVMAAGRVKMI